MSIFTSISSPSIILTTSSSLASATDVEIDIWFISDNFYLGHDGPQYKIDFEWVNNRKNRLWVHCKNIDAIVQIKKLETNKLYTDINFFFHDKDDLTLTSKNYLWVHPGKQPVNNSIAVLPELLGDDTSVCIGICSDKINDYT